MTHVDGGLELLDRLHGTWCNNDHSALDLLPLDTTKQRAHIVTSLSPVEFLVEHLDTSEGCLNGLTKADNLHIRALGGNTPLALTRHQTCALLD